MSSPHNHRSGRGDTSRRSAQLPAFCRSRSSRSQLVSVSNLRNLQRLLLLVLLIQLSTLLLVIAGPVPQRPLWPEFHKSAIKWSVRP
ncbi:MAG: hypothetical protein KFB97_03570 [Cyanobium sp. M30B3]|nr:MAG: hypothetical protein KFB97_03570 [Cyanobium sp. M30B3]